MRKEFPTHSDRPPDSGAPTVHARAYTASLVPNGFSFHPSSHGNPAHAEFHTRFVGTDTRTAFRADESNPSPSEWKVTGNTAQRLISEEMGLVEHLQASDEGMELSWIFTENPKISSETIQIETTITGMSYTGSTDSGHHFADSQGMDRIRIGQTLIVDSRGKTALLTSTIIDDYLQIKIPSHFLDQALYPVAVDPTISAEMGTDQPVIIIAPDDQENPTVAFDGSTFLVVWEDDRNSSHTNIFATRVSIEGEILDPRGLPITTAIRNQSQPVVGSNNDGFLVVWTDERILDKPEIHGAFFNSTEGNLDLQEFVISNSTGLKKNPSIAGNTEGYLIVWEDSPFESEGTTDIAGAWVTSADNVQSLTIFDGAENQILPAVTHNGTDFWVAWQSDTADNGSQIFGSLVLSGNPPTVSQSIAVTSSAGKQTQPTVASNGTVFITAWKDERNDAGDIYGARITSEGVLFDIDGFIISNAAQEQSHPSIAASGVDFLATWQDLRNGSFDIYGTRITDIADVSDPGGIQIGKAAEAQVRPSVSGMESGYLVTWTDDRSSSGPDVYGSIVSAFRGGAGQADTAIPVSTAANRQRNPVVAGNGILNLVVWQDNRIQSLEDIYGVRVDASGTILDPEGLPISIATNSQSRPAVASNGTDFLVVWQDTRISFSNLEIYAARVQSDGNLPDPDGIRVTDSSFSQRNPTVAGLDNTYMVAWEDLTNGSSNSDIMGTRISVQGILLDDPPIEISTVGQKQRTPSAAAGAELFFIVWADTRDDSLDDIFGARVTEQGNNQDPEGISIATGSISQRNPKITFDGEEFFAVWVQRGLTTSFDIYGSPLGIDGQVLKPDGIAISVISGNQSEVALASNGATVMSVWTDTSLDPAKDIRGTWISRDTRSIPDDPLSYSVSDAVESKPSIGITNDGYLAAYEVVRADGFSRIELRRYRSPDFPPEITEIEDQETIANFAVLQIPFTVTDDETPPQEIVLKIRSSNPDLIPSERIGIDGTGEARQLNLIPQENQTGTATITISALDSGGKEHSQSFMLTVMEAPPIIQLQPLDRSAPIGADATFIVRVTGSAPLAFQWFRDGILIPNAESETLSLQNITQADAGSYRVEIVNSVGSVTSSDAQLIIQSENTAPRFLPIADQVVDEDNPLVIFLLAEDADRPSQRLLFTLEPGAPENIILDPLSGLLTWTPTEQEGPETYDISIKVTDNGQPSKSATTTFAIQVNEVNQAPVLAPLQNIQIFEGFEASFQVTATDVDFPKQLLTYRIRNEVPQGAVLDIGTGQFSWIPTEEQGPGVFLLSIEVSDNATPPLVAVAEVVVSVSERNQPPILQIPDAPLFITVGEPVSFPVIGTDPDIPIQNLEYSLVAPIPEGAAIDTVTGLLTWSPPDGFQDDGIAFRIQLSDDGTPPLITESTLSVSIRQEFRIGISDSINGLFNIVIESAEFGALITLEASTDLKSWIEIAQTVYTGNSLQITDPDSNSPIISQRFYRAVISP